MDTYRLQLKHITGESNPALDFWEGPPEEAVLTLRYKKREEVS